MKTEADRLQNVKFSPVRQVLAKAQELEKQGRDIVHFEIGEPDFDTPLDIVKETIKALEDKKTHYASNLGDMALRQEIAKYMETKGVKCDPNTEILVTCGAAEAIFVSLMSLIDEGDEVIIFTPAFMFYENTINMAGAKVVEVELKKENNFQICIDDVRAKLTDKTKMIIVNNPHNPSGTVFNRESLTALGRLAVEKGIYIVTDEIYSEIVYDGTECFALMSEEAFHDNVITINGFSKAYAMTGWRLGYIVANPKVRQSMLKVHQYTVTCLPTFIQVGLAKVMNSKPCLDDVEAMRKVFEERRNLLASKLDEIPNLSYIKPQGAFYCLVDVSALGMSDFEFAEKLLSEQGVAVVPASSFSASFKNHIRISYATSTENIARGLDRLKAFCELHKK